MPITCLRSFSIRKQALFRAHLRTNEPLCRRDEMDNFELAKPIQNTWLTETHSRSQSGFAGGVGVSGSGAGCLFLKEKDT
jgi:hypothetical protein